MSGICGWNNNHFTMEKSSEIINKMASSLLINQTHSIKKASQKYCSLASTGLSNECDITIVNNIGIVIKGSLRWSDTNLQEMFISRGLTQTIQHAYETYDISFLNKISGSFAICIVDISKQKTIIAIDKIGIESMFFSFINEQLIFSSNARSILCHPDSIGDVNPQSIFDYLFFHMIPSPRSIFEKMEKLGPGEYLSFENKKIIKKQYWIPSYIETNNNEITLLKREFLHILEKTVSNASTNPLTGSFLSGGTDSSTISGMLRKIQKKPINTYSIGFDTEGFDETKYARIAASHFKTTPHEYYLKPQDVVDAIPEIASAYDEPFGNASAVPAYYCAKLANNDGIKVLLAGDGGDEIFAGNLRYAKQKIFELYLHIPYNIRNLIIEPAIFNFPYGDNLWPINKSKSYINQANIPLPNRMETYNFLNRIPLTEIFEAEFLNSININEPSNFLCERYGNAPTKSTLNKMLFLDLKFTLADNDLRKVNRMCELANIEVKYPFLDDEFIVFSSKLPPSLKLNGLSLRYLFKEALKDFLPREVLSKQKQGFGLPFGIWMNNYLPLSDIAFESITSLSKRGIIKPDFINSIQNHHKTYPGYYGVIIWVLMMLEQWFKSVK